MSLKINNSDQFVRLLTDNIFDSKNNDTNFWTDLLVNSPNSKLLKDNIFGKTLKKGHELHLVSAIEKNEVDLVRNPKLVAGMGCLGNVIYTVQSFPEEANLYRLHNFGTCVMRHKEPDSYTPVKFTVNLSKVNVASVNYLRMGELFNHLATENIVLNNDKLKNKFEDYSMRRLAKVRPYIDDIISDFKSHRVVYNIEDSRKVITEISGNIKNFRSLSYIYFEAVSLALMLHSTDKETLKYLSNHEYNNHIYVDLMHRYRELRGAKKFESYGFSPNINQLDFLFDKMTGDGIINIDKDKVMQSIANNIKLYIGTSMYSLDALKGHLFYDFCIDDDNIKICSPILDEKISKIINSYFDKINVDILFNSTIEKGEIGINPHIKPEAIKTFVSEYTKEAKGVITVVEITTNIKPYHK